MDNKPYLSVIIPIYKKTDWLPITLIDIDKYLSGAGFNYEILIVDNFYNENNGILESVLKLKSIIKNIHYVSCAANKSKSGKQAILSGLKESKGELKLFLNTDNFVSVNHFFQADIYFKKERGEEYDIVIGNRKARNLEFFSADSLFYKICENIKNIFIKIMVLPDIKDPQCEFKCFSEKSARQIFSMVKTDNEAADVESLVIAKKIGYKIKEIPVVWKNNLGITVETPFFKILLDVFKIRLWIWGNVYKIKNN